MNQMVEINIPDEARVTEDWTDVDKPIQCIFAASQCDVTSPLSPAPVTDADAAADDDNDDVLASSVKLSIGAESPTNRGSSSTCSLTLQCNHIRNQWAKSSSTERKVLD